MLMGTICGIQGSDEKKSIQTWDGIPEGGGSLARPNTFTAKLTLHQFIGEALIPPVLT